MAAVGDLGQRRAPVVGELPLGHDHLGHHRVAHQRDQLALVADVVVERHRPGAEALGDLAHRDRVEAFRVGDLERRAGDVGAGVGRAARGGLVAEPDRRLGLVDRGGALGRPPSPPARSACSIARATFSPARSSASATRSSARAIWSCACSERSRTFASARSTFSRARAARSSNRSRSRSSRFLSESLDISYIVPLACSYAVLRQRTRYEMNQEPNTSHAVVAEGLGKRYGEQWALREFDLVGPDRLGARPARP